MGVVKHSVANLRALSLLFIWMFCYSSPAIAKNTDGIRPSHTINFEQMKKGQYIIAAYINGQGPFKMMIDTAATRTAIFEKTRILLGREILQDNQALINGMTDSVLRPTLQIDSLKLAGQSFDNRKIVVLDDWYDPDEPLDGILGLDVLGGLTLHFVHKHNQIRVLSHGELDSVKYRRWKKINLKPNPYPVQDFGLLFTETVIGNIRIPTMVDTGAHFTTINWQSVKNTSLESKRRRLHHDWVVQGAVGQFKPRHRIKMDVLTIGGIPFKNHEMLIMNFEQFPINDYGKYPLVIAGIDLIAGRDFIFDFKSKILLIAPKFSSY